MSTYFVDTTLVASPEAYSEHPNWHPNLGAWYTSQFIDILVSDPDVFRKTVLFVNYDEDGGFFDHDVPPTPPQSRANGLSTVSTVNELFPGDAMHPSGPYGLGVRVPMVVISPWSKGGYLNSQVFDLTSLIHFIEKRFSRVPMETNITPWQRAVAGDLTSAFDFENPYSRYFSLARFSGWYDFVITMARNRASSTTSRAALKTGRTASAIRR